MAIPQPPTGVDATWPGAFHAGGVAQNILLKETEGAQSMIHLIQHHDTKVLAHELLRRLKERAAEGLFRKEIVVVPTPGLKRWISLMGAQSEGVFLGVEFKTPTQFFMDLSFLTLGKREDRSLFEEHNLPWAILHILLTQSASTPQLAMLQTYLTASGSSEQKLFGLAQEIAALFDRYEVYRPEMLAAWERGERLFAENPYEEWQQALWQKLCTLAQERGQGISISQRYLKTIEELSHQRAQKELPPRVFFFGLSTISPLHLRLLDALSTTSCTVQLFHQLASKEYVGDLFSDREALSQKAKAGDTTDTALLYLESGNRLLANLGILGREYMELLYRVDIHEEEILSPEPKSPPQLTLLHALQEDLHLCREESESSAITPNAQDSSLRIHRCHTPLREIEVLADAIFDAIEHRGLAPSDILVLTPNVEQYAPSIDQIFGNAEQRFGTPLPYGISDRSHLTVEPQVVHFTELLATVSSRFEASRIAALFEEHLRLLDRGITHDEMQYCHKWIAETGIRWGIDGPFHEDQKLPYQEDFTWRKGLDRALAGYAMRPLPNSTEAPYLYGEIEGLQASLLGDLVHFVEALMALYHMHKEPKPSHIWQQELKDWLYNLYELKENDVQESLTTLLHALATLNESATLGMADEPLTFAMVERALVLLLGQSGTAGEKFFTGKITFATLIPLRSIPFKMVAVLGLNQGSFPRVEPLHEFNLMRLKRTLGDRDQRTSDTYLFLETLLAAQEQLHLSFCGLSEKDNTAMPPSSVLEQLLSYLAQSYGTHEANHPWLISHPLQPFSLRYNHPPLFTYNQSWNSCAPRGSDTPPLTWPTAVRPGATMQEYDGNEILATLQKYSELFLTKQCRITLPRPTESLEDVEPFLVEGLNRYALDQAILEKRMTGGTTLARLENQGGLPVGSFYDAALIQEEQAITKLFDLVPPGATQRPLSIQVTLGGSSYRFSSTPELCHEKQLYLFKTSSVKAKDRVRHWITHLFLNLAGDYTTHLLNSDSPIVLAPLSMEEAAEEIRALHQLLTTATHPLPLFLEALWAYHIKKEGKETTPEERQANRLASVWSSVVGGNYHFGPYETATPYGARFVGDAYSFDDFPPAVVDHFITLSQTLFGPYTRSIVPGDAA